MKDEYKLISSVDEITEDDILKRLKYVTLYSEGWFRIDKGKEGYSIYGLVCGNIPNYVSSGTYVKTWKTLNNVKRAINRFAIKGYWGFRNKFSNIKNERRK